MTCVVGIIDGRRVVVGADSVGVSDGYTISRADRKVFRNGEYVIGFTSSYRMGQVLRFAELPSPPKQRSALYRFMVTHFVESTRDIFANAGFRRKENEVESGGTFLVGVRGRLFEVNSDFQVGVPRHGWCACGSGIEVASGAMWATRGLDLSAETRVRRAIAAAAEFNAYVRGPVHMESA